MVDAEADERSAGARGGGDDGGGRALPRYVARELRAYLRCGILAHGFARARCDGCGVDVLVAFSCKGRGLCPSCGARRMTGAAARLVDAALPAVTVRQWVLSLPYELRMLLAARADVLRSVVRVFWEEVQRYYVTWAAGTGHRDVRAGSLTAIQRFGGSLNLRGFLDAKSARSASDPHRLSASRRLEMALRWGGRERCDRSARTAG